MDPKELEEIVTLGATDGDLYGHAFFPKAFRCDWGEMHHDIWKKLLTGDRYVAIQAFRGAAKTTLTRTYVSHRIAYGLAHTVMFTSASQSHAVRSLDWLKRQVLFNRLWAETFQLQKGEKWTEDECEIIHGVDGYPIRVVAVGMTGQIRGLNIDDHRPDLIVCDDPQSEESANTPEQRQKLEGLFFGSLAKTLASAEENPHAKMVLLQTPLHREDLISQAAKDPQWVSSTYGCFDENGESRWPALFPTETLRAEREAHIARHQLPLWLREMECKLVDAESAAFRSDWLQYYDMVPDDLQVFFGIDPASSDAKDADFQVISVIGVRKSETYLLEYVAKQGQNPEEFMMEFFRLVVKWKPMSVVVETVAYQKTLAYYLKKEMLRRGIFVPISEYKDRRSKFTRIVQAFSGRASMGQFFLRRSMREFIEQFVDYPEVSHDDILDATAMAMSKIPAMLEANFAKDAYMSDAYADDEYAYHSMGELRAVP